MIDIHSHVLPCMDDGSKSPLESRRMLWRSARQEIRYMAATPHFYPAENSPEEFLIRREQAAARLQAEWRPYFPKLLLGAEVYYFEGISQADHISSLCIQESHLLLLEMPFAPWTDRMLDEIRHLNQRQEITVLLAHIERYLRFQKKAAWDELLQAGVLMQCNAEFFIQLRTRYKALGMLKAGRIHFLGSDCHNMKNRPPRLGEAMEIIGEEGQQMLEKNARRYLPILGQQQKEMMK